MAKMSSALQPITSDSQLMHCNAAHLPARRDPLWSERACPRKGWHCETAPSPSLGHKCPGVGPRLVGVLVIRPCRLQQVIRSLMVLRILPQLTACTPLQPDMLPRWFRVQVGPTRRLYVSVQGKYYWGTLKQSCEQKTLGCFGRPSSKHLGHWSLAVFWHLHYAPTVMRGLFTDGVDGCMRCNRASSLQ